MIDRYVFLSRIIDRLVDDAISRKAYRRHDVVSYAETLCLLGAVVVELARYILDYEEKSNYWGE